MSDIMDVMDRTREDEAREIIDRGLSLAGSRSLVPSGEMVDLLLDLRALFPEPKETKP